MKKGIIIPLTLVVLLFNFPSEALSFKGPLRVRNQFPLFLHLDPPYLETASYERSLSVILSHSSVFLLRSSQGWSAGLDLELTELNLRYRTDILNLFELGIDIPLLSFTSGFMDGLLSSYHRTFGFPDYGRDTRPANQFLYELKKNGSMVVKGESGRIGLGDIRLSVKRALLASDPAVSLMASLELPTGNASTGYGSGSLDGGLALLVEKRISEKVRTYFNFGAVSPGDLKAHQRIGLREFLYGGISAEAEPYKGLCLIGQIMVQTSPFPETDISSIDRTSVLFTVGGRYSSGKDSVELSFTEDPSTSGAPDFTLTFSYKRTF